MATTTNTETDKGDQPASTREQLISIAEGGSEQELETLVSSLHPADVAEAIDLLERAEPRNRVFGVLAPDTAPQVLSLISPLSREKIVQDLPEARVRSILEHLDSDDAADLLGSVPSERAQSILAGLAGPLSARIQQLLRY